MDITSLNEVSRFDGMEEAFLGTQDEVGDAIASIGGRTKALYYGWATSYPMEFGICLCTT